MPSSSCIDRDLLVVKATYFFFYSGMACVTPYISIYTRHLGLLPSQTGVIIAAKTFMSALISPLLGTIADKTGRPKLVVILTVATASALHFLLLFVPPVRSTSTSPTTHQQRHIVQGNCTKETYPEPEHVSDMQRVDARDSWSSPTFWIVFWIMFTSHGAQWSSLAQMDSAIYQIIRSKENATFGMFGGQRLWGSVGCALLALISGVAMDTFTNVTRPDNSGNKTNYSVTFSMFLAFMVVTLGCLIVLDDWSTGPSVAFLKGMRRLLSQVHFLIFLLVTLLLGAYYGARDTFVAWHLKDLGASQTVIGSDVSVRTVAEIPVFIISGWIIDKLGHMLALELGFVTFGLNFLCYSFIRNPWWALLIDVTHGYKAVIVTAATSYASISAPDDLQAAAQGIVAASLFGIGFGVGSLISGPVFHRYGAVVLFRALAVCCVVAFILFYLLHRWFGRNKDPTDLDSGGEQTVTPMLLPAADLPKPDAFLRGGSITSAAGESMGSLSLVRPQIGQ